MERGLGALVRNRKKIFLAMLLVAVIAISLYVSTSFLNSRSGPQATVSEQTLASGVLVTNGVKHIVPLDKILSGGPPKDGIPSIDRPKFVSSKDGDGFLLDEDLVFGLYYAGEARAYPAMILVWHEIVNDIVNGQPVLVTYCPLCYASAAYERMIDGKAVEFGVSGKLYNSDLVMYDRKTDTYWSQILGKAIVGELTDQELKRIPIDHVSWGVWKTLHPDTTVLSLDTGYRRSYGSDPYGDYYQSSSIWFPVDNPDDRLHPKTLVYGLATGGEQKAYTRDIMVQREVINDKVGEFDVAVWVAGNGPMRAFDRQMGNDTLEFTIENGRIFDTKTHSEWNANGLAISGQYSGTQLTRLVGITCFWFAWAAFYQNTDLYS